MIDHCGRAVYAVYAVYAVCLARSNAGPLFSI
jgi:hypothetical protein